MTFNIGRLPTLLANLLAVASALLLVSCAKSEPVRGDAKAVDAQHLVAIYQYLASDYPLAVASGDAGELAEQRSLSGEAVSLANRLGNGALAVRAASIDARVRDGRDAAGVREDCGSLVDDVIAAAGLTRAPSAPPDLDEGARLFQQTCATCHGPTGRGDGPAAASLNPRPASFHSPELMGGLTPFKAFNAIRFGVNGTAMAPFDSLDEKRRWALAFFVFSLRQPDCNHPPPRVSLDDLANLTDDELSKRIGSADIACARRKLPELDGAAMIAAAQKRVEEGARMAKRGDPHGAEKLILDAYLTSPGCGRATRERSPTSRARSRR